MTVKDVKDAVLAYGYSPDLEDNDTLFYAAINRALREINRVRPRCAVASIVHEPYAPVAYDNSVQEYVPEHTLSFVASARSCVFEADGVGAVKATSNEKTKTVDWNGGVGWQRVAISFDKLGELTLTFSGDYGYHVRNIAFFTQKTPPSGYGPNVVEYDLPTLFEDFSAVSEIYRDGAVYSAPHPMFSILDGRLLRIPESERGTYEIVYEVKLPRYTGENNDDDEIPLDDELCDILPLLVASIVWSNEGERELSVYYRNQYKEALSTIEPKRRVLHVIDTRGWA
jgi:hypothetical protein